MDKFSLTTDFIRRTFHKESGFLALHEPTFAGNEKQYLEECIDSTFVSSVGKFVDRFEDEMAQYTGVTKAVVCVNGTSALHMALLLAGVKPQEEVITQPFTFIATANAIAYCGADPVFVDIDRDTLGLSPEKLSEWFARNVQIDKKTSIPVDKLTGRRVAACVPMHTFGHPCKIDDIIAVCEKYNVPVVEDAAESIGSLYKSRHTGTYGKIGVLSFNGNKILTTGGGGMLLFNDAALAQRAKHLTTQAKVPHAWEFVHDEIGYNYRMPNINAALGLAQLEQIDRFLAAKRKLALSYKSFFGQTGIDFVTEPENAKSNYWLNAILLNNKEERNEFLTFTNKNGVMTRPAWELMHRLPMFEKAQRGGLSNAEWVSERLVNLPSSVIL